VLAGLACVDAVTLFDEAAPARLISELLPDVLVKAGITNPNRWSGEMSWKQLAVAS
jgi:bifunctional ADP-heptose synthase (sugar kinase/adenylyltransferase)